MITKEHIQKALAQGEFDYFYQPKISAVTGDIVGAEALARWIKPDGQIIPPAAFIPLAEETGLITQMTLLLFEKLKQCIHSICRIKPLCISFNASVDDLNSDALTNQIIRAIKSKSISADNIELEITESKLIDESNSLVRDNLNRLVKSGVGLAMDDFGTGYSSIQVLADYPFSSLKLDHNLVNGITSHNKKKFIAKTAIRMAHLLKLDIIAEGVENNQQYNLLQHMGCTTLQGYLISKPLPFDNFIDFVKQNMQFRINVSGTLHMIFIDHILWYRDFVCHAGSKLQKCDKIFLPLPEMDPEKCMFGEYFSKLNKIILKDIFPGKSVEKLEQTHKSIHHDAQKIIEHLDQQNIPGNDFDPMFAHFKELHMEFIRQLEVFEIRFLKPPTREI